MKTTRSASGSAGLILVIRKLLVCVSVAASGLVPAAMTPITDSELSSVNGQALFMSQKETAGAYDFYKMGLDAQLDLNANIKELKLGETSGAGGGVDLWAQNLAFGCIADASNNCVDSTGGTATHLKPFTLMRPYIQIVTKGANAAQREVVGIRMGAESAQGPLSIGNFLSFSGYLSATGNITMQAQGQNGATDDVAITCGPTTGPCPHGSPPPNGDWGNNGVNTFGLNEPLRALGLNNDQACFLSLCAQFRDLTAKYGATSRNNLPIVLQGRRQNQAFIQNTRLSDAVDEITNTLSISRSNASLNAGLIDFILPILKGNIGNKIKSQLATGLGTTTANLNTYQIPYNVENLHSADVNSPLFGLSFQKEAGVQYPGYAVPMDKGWSMYLPNAFTLSISQPTTQFVSNIMSGGAKAGNIIQLPVGGGRNVYDNCWGSAVFC